VHTGIAILLIAGLEELSAVYRGSNSGWLSYEWYKTVAEGLRPSLSSLLEYLAGFNQISIF